eukprot:CAMPEP_0118862424 /NCGR_PEP_ID=MMETSP1163-20130328/7628_1 /TAXON_ID=124430 /ORGANISM="Phaeomonas parva, Strain CCMP2877" /LENGTH=230 /DNA_ID=CAMNT_0006796331 /DNA_START=125 /DNA_END=817 /DNA_ORIENTATION=+
MAAMVEKTLRPPVMWAQRKDSLYVTFKLQDVKDESISLTATTLSFAGTSNNKSYAVEMDLFKEVDPESSTWKVLPRSIQMHIMKKEEDEDPEEGWARLLKDKALQKSFVSIDWDKWQDEDDDDPAAFDTSALDGGMNFGGAGGMPGMGGGMPGMGGGMPGMGGGAGGMDMAALMQQMQGMGGMPGMEGMGGMPGMEAMGGMPGMGDDEEDSDDDLPPLDDLNLEAKQDTE